MDKYVYPCKILCMCTFDKVRVGVTRASLKLIAEITCSINYIQQVTNYW